jgi:minor extracellular protease Epr
MKRISIFAALVAGILLCAVPAFGRSDHERVPREERPRDDNPGRERSREARDGEREHPKPDTRSPRNDGSTSRDAGGSNVSGSGVSGSGGGEVSVSSSVGDDDRSDDDKDGSSGSGSGDSDEGGAGGDSSGSGDGSGSGDSSGSGDDDASGDDDSATEFKGREIVRVEVDREGRERRAGEVLLVGREHDVSVVARQGYAVLSRHLLDGSEGVVARLQVRSGETVDVAVMAVRALAPEARVSANFLFRPSGASGAASAIPLAQPRDGQTKGHIGMIDTGIDASNPRLRGAVIARRSFLGPYVPRDHGTGVAQVAVASGVAVSSVDVFGEDERGLPVASVEAIVRGLDWFIARRESVVNVSIAGPNTPVLADMVLRAQRQGMVIVAAAGNEGPGAAPAFPAALDGVVAVTAIDQSGRVYRRANRGHYIDFAAVGVRVGVLGDDGRVHPVSGTSFAAPRVAAALAQRLSRSSARDGTEVVRALAAEAKDLGPRGRDPTYGWGGIPD